MRAQTKRRYPKGTDGFRSRRPKPALPPPSVERERMAIAVQGSLLDSCSSLVLCCPALQSAGVCRPPFLGAFTDKMIMNDVHPVSLRLLGGKYVSKAFHRAIRRDTICDRRKIVAIARIRDVTNRSVAARSLVTRAQARCGRFALGWAGLSWGALHGCARWGTKRERERLLPLLMWHHPPRDRNELPVAAVTASCCSSPFAVPSREIAKLERETHR
ncbi:hypothetical protein IWX49DRAFT_583662 [Phyllosticta citricarpa]|uniref:Uncharacterized protein n=2 Tax=Phyllosticta TaxID=121621 RepID=A0ABR1LD48_9PEZI